LLADGIGDTVRVSLTEDSIHEIPVARALVEITSNRADFESFHQHAIKHVGRSGHWSFDPFSYGRRATERLIVSGISPASTDGQHNSVALGGEELIRVVIANTNFENVAHKVDRMGDYKPEIVYENVTIREVDPRSEKEIAEINRNTSAQLVTVRDGIELPVIAAFRLLAAKLEPRHPIVLKDTL